MHRSVQLVVLAALCLVLSSCSLFGSGDDLALDDREFWSTSVEEAGGPIDLVANTRITLGFREGRLFASAGCNSMSGGFDVDGDQLVTNDLAQTAMGCDPERHEQDEMLARLLGSRPVVTLAGDELVLRGGDLVVTLIDSSVANPDRPLLDTVWEVDGFLSGATASAFSTPTRARFTFHSDGSVVGTDGCQPLSARVSIEGDQLEFVDVFPIQEGACANQDYVDTFFDAIATSHTWSISGDSLTLMDSNGFGLTARAVS